MLTILFFKDASGNSIPGQKGQMSLKVEGGVLFFVSGYKGNTNQGFLSLITQKAELYHAGRSPRKVRLRPKYLII